MDLAAARQRGTQLDPGNDLHPMAVSGGACLADTGHRVVIGERKDAHATRSGLLHQHRWRKETVRVGAMRVEIDFLSRGVVKSSSRGEVSSFSTPRHLDSLTLAPRRAGWQ